MLTDPRRVAVLMLVIGFAGCHRRETPHPSAGASASAAVPTRGARVVVEETAAEFFEGRVLSATHDTLRVQTTTGGDTRHVAVEDAYLLPAPPHVYQTGDLAICRASTGHWVACRVERIAGGNLDAVDADSNSLHLHAGDLLAPTPVTLMNLRQRFKRERERADFLLSVRRAGRPIKPSSWHVTPHERILAQRGDQWYAADVHEIDDDTLHVIWRSDGRESEVPASQVVPEPPTDAMVRSGDFVLARPANLGAAWEPWRVTAAADDAYQLVDIDGTRRTVGPRDLLPLRK